MKPVQDTFTSHIQSLYDGHEVAPPQGMQDSVFNKLDADSSGSYSLTSKAILVASSLLIGCAWFFMPVTEVAVVQEVVVEEVAVEVVDAAVHVVVEEVVVQNPVSVPDLQVSSADIVPAKTESIEIATTVVPVEEKTVANEASESPVLVATPPVEVVKETEKVEEKKKAVEWVLPAKLKVDEGS